MADRPDITPELCRQLLRYEPETGRLFWRRRSREMFASKRSFTMWHTRYAEMEAFTAYDGRGYKNGAILYETHLAHRVIWAIVHGEWPEHGIDHINGQRDDNRLSNLRSATYLENQQNRGRSTNNTSGVVGVSWCKSKDRWEAKIRANGRTKWLGYFETIEEAKTARVIAEAQLGFSATHGKRDAFRRSRADISPPAD